MDKRGYETMTDELFEIIKIQNNIKNHDFDVSDLKITKRESEVISMCLETQKHLLDFDEEEQKDETTV